MRRLTRRLLQAVLASAVLLLWGVGTTRGDLTINFGGSEFDKNTNPFSGDNRRLFLNDGGDSIDVTTWWKDSLLRYRRSQSESRFDRFKHLSRNDSRPRLKYNTSAVIRRDSWSWIRSDRCRPGEDRHE